jgi:hypothetical protein
VHALGLTAASHAAAQVEAVRDDPAARLALIERTYDGSVGLTPWSLAPRHLRFRRAALSFMRWQLARGVLAPIDSQPPGSPWWRAVNERLLRDGCEAVACSAGLGGRSSSHAIRLWTAFIARPTARSWYLAHNASIVAAYLEHRDLASTEGPVERFFFDVVLVRVLYAHALVASPRLSLGWFAPLGGLLGDPRLGMAGAFLSLRHILPDRYPAPGDVEAYLEAEHSLGRLLDYAVIAPRLQPLYEWSAAELGEPGLLSLIADGRPAYASPPADLRAWRPMHAPLPLRMLQLAISPH